MRIGAFCCIHHKVKGDKCQCSYYDIKKCVYTAWIMKRNLNDKGTWESEKDLLLERKVSDAWEKAAGQKPISAPPSTGMQLPLM